ncbi:MAG: hypothetical protein IT497_01120 [Ottowia sp.]|jgi:hypothetical protein|nr:hypothetical protein [Ottowia sp.]
MPLARQENDNNGSWLINSEKIYLPLINNQEKDAFFGLDEQSIQAYWSTTKEEIDNKKFHYRFISKKENCAGVILSALKAAGSEYFVPFNSNVIVSTPNDVHKYVLNIQRKIDALNEKNSKIRYFYGQSKQALEPNPISNQSLSEASAATLKQKFNIEVGKMSSTEQKQCAVLRKLMEHIPRQTTDLTKLRPYSIALVEALSDLLSNTRSNPQSQSMTKALVYAATVRELLEESIKLSQAPVHLKA